MLCLAACGCGGFNSATSSTNDTQPPPAGSDNRPPTAQISGSHVTHSGETVTLDGSGSSDPDGDSLVFRWSQAAGPALGLGDSSNSSLSFVAPTVSQPTQYSFRLLVDDGELTDSSDFNLQLSPLSDAVSPSVTLRSPAPDETGLAVSTRITVTFDEALLSSSIDASSLTLGLGSDTIPGSVSYDDNSHSIVFTPSAPLAEASSYRISLGDSATGLAGNSATAQSRSFTTTADYNLGATTLQTIDLCMDDDDKEMLTLVNNTRAAAQSLAWHCQLENAAQVHSDAMASNDFFDHTGLNGSSPGYRITAAGYDWYTYGENIAAGYGDVQAAMDAWTASPGHCANRMNPNFTEMGAAMGSDADSTYGIYWTQDFAAQ